MYRKQNVITIICVIMIISLFAPNQSFADTNIKFTVQNQQPDEKTCRQIGMIPNDESQGQANYNRLTQALNAGTKILVDNKYYISGVKNPETIMKDIIFEGITEDAEISFTGSEKYQSYFLNIKSKNFTMKKIKFTQLSDEIISAFNICDSHKINTFIIEDCYFEGSIKLVTWNFTNRVYPDPTQYGITNFAFNNNICKNIKNSFIQFSNVPINNAQIIGNNINNFSYVFYNQDASKSNPYLDKVAELMTYLEVRNNTVINDSSWNGAPKPQLYHSFIYFDGNKCDYFDNYIEGIHALDQETVVYDAYLSCIDLDYEGNYWKNNISFSSYDGGRQLMKSKFAHKSDYNGIKRVYKNNTYIVEKSYADIMNRPYDELWVSLGRVEREMDTFIVENNKFDVYKLRLNETQYVHNYIFNNNEIHAYAVQETYHNSILPVSKLEHPASTDTYIVKNNIITIETSRISNQKDNSLIIVGGQKEEMKR